MEKELEDCRNRNSSLIRYCMKYEFLLSFVEVCIFYKNHLRCCIFYFVWDVEWKFSEFSDTFYPQTCHPLEFFHHTSIDPVLLQF